MLRRFSGPATLNQGSTFVRVCNSKQRCATFWWPGCAYGFPVLAWLVGRRRMELFGCHLKIPMLPLAEYHFAPFGCTRVARQAIVAISDWEPPGNSAREAITPKEELGEDQWSRSLPHTWD